MESVPFVNNDKSTVNWYVLRYADVLLLYAEVLNEWKGGPTTDAYAAIEKVRKRGYNGANGYKLTQGMDQAQFREAIQKNVLTNWRSKDIAVLISYVGAFTSKQLKRPIQP